MAKKQKAEEKKESVTEKNLRLGLKLHGEHDFFYRLIGYSTPISEKKYGKDWMAVVDREGTIFCNKDFFATPEEWSYAFSHCQLHLAFGHFDAEKMPGYEVVQSDGSKRKKVDCNLYLWNMACDIYIAKFLADMKLAGAECENPSNAFPIALQDELEIYEYLVEHHYESKEQLYGTGNRKGLDMQGLDKPCVYGEDECNYFAKEFSVALVESIADAICEAGEHSWGKRDYQTDIQKAANWFVDHYPLLGGVASGFRIVEDMQICQKEEIQIAAVDSQEGVIYANPGVNLCLEEWKFVLAHEFLHAGLEHQERCQGRDSYLWNVACDYVINGWLQEMQVGKMPELGILYDETLKGMSAESIYELICMDLKWYLKKGTFRGHGMGDIMRKKKTSSFRGYGQSTSLDDFYRSALSQGLEYANTYGRGRIPAGLQEEIRALAMPPIRWDIQLAQWFELHFSEKGRVRSYARPSRRQGATPDIPRPRYVPNLSSENDSTFGVVIDTSGSMSTQMIGMALGSVASYAAAKGVAYVRVVFCDASAYDAGYLATEEIAGKVEVKGRGGTVLQPGIDLLEQAKDFPKDGPILIITDGMIEGNLNVHWEHAFLIPKGSRLPFRTRGNVFYME